MDESIGKDEAFVKDWLVRQGLEKPVNVFYKYRYAFSILDISSLLACNHINISDKVNYILFITVKTITDVNTA